MKTKKDNKKKNARSAPPGASVAPQPCTTPGVMCRSSHAHPPPTRTALSHRRTSPGDLSPRDLPSDVPGALHGASDVRGGHPLPISPPRNKPQPLDPRRASTQHRHATCPDTPRPRPTACAVPWKVLWKVLCTFYKKYIVVRTVSCIRQFRLVGCVRAKINIASNVLCLAAHGGVRKEGWPPLQPSVSHTQRTRVYRCTHCDWRTPRCRCCWTA